MIGPLIAKNADSLVLATPSLTLSTIGAGFRMLEDKKNIAAKTVGFLGARTFITLGVVAALPLIVYNCAKAIFAKLLNLVTFNKVKEIRNFAKHTETVLKVSIALVAAVALIALSLPNVIAGGKAIKNIVNKALELVNNFTKSLPDQPAFPQVALV